MKCLSYNIHHGVGLDEKLSLGRIANLIKDAEATIIGLQEVDRFFGERSQFQDQGLELAKQLDFHFTYGANINEPPLSGHTENRQYGNALLSKYPIVEVENISLPTLDPEPRGVIKALLDVHGVSVCVMNTHLSLDKESQQLQIQRLIELISTAKSPVILMGDFNAEVNNEEIKTLLTQTNLTDCFAGIEQNQTFPADAPTSRIDYIFMKGLQTKQSYVLQGEGSDHLPIVTEINFTKGG
ncbi:endonuclease/exonuclease/phosphatase family protein [Lederbergia galactosidilytica]|uniref:endonuclease/exonuclease/phosphatase family protein n=1 Tax=Lederbergia galactosidilytica TaxID=217031 RepID=UPI0007174781|nr:endonuclease/exonuclease/phosphatase family protein [Lederbergia galactosidilytica]MBP1917507.1 endonuclease/exonuclease/phosphatase family metal-dependent hydrolase [Lederbergia galactosidilytica]